MKQETYRRPHWALVVAVAVLLLAVLVAGLVLGTFWFAFWGIVAAILLLGGLLIPGLLGTEGSMWFYICFCLIPAFVIITIVFDDYLF